MFVSVEYRKYSQDSPELFRVDRRTFTSICGSHNFSFTLAEYINPPWDAFTLNFVGKEFLEMFLRIVEHADIMQEVVDTRFAFSFQLGLFARLLTLGHQ